MRLALITTFKTSPGMGFKYISLDLWIFFEYLATYLKLHLKIKQEVSRSLRPLKSLPVFTLLLFRCLEMVLFRSVPRPSCPAAIVCHAI